MKKNIRCVHRQSGFTLIELLVVVAIIGILSSVVLASFGSARDKGKDSAVKAQLSSMRAQAELYYSVNEAYTGVCDALQSANGFGGAGGPGLLLAVKTADSIPTTNNFVLTTPGDWNLITCHADVESWAVEAPMTDSTSGARDMYCVDSTGVSQNIKGATQALANLAASDSSCQ